ncbi:MAG: MBOAT family protein [Muribaculum sp.]|nr:MBOAT family protein [Muribaculum sp.]
MAKPNKTIRYRKIVCTVGCVIPLVILGLFKYYNFITSVITNSLSHVGLRFEMPQLEFLMPIGISFYTFTAVGYLIDIYRRKYKVEKNFLILSLFVGFFAQIASGPIPRGGHLIPQLRQPDNLSYDNVISGLRTMLWGFFMKLCVANRVAIYVDAIYGNMSHHNGTSLILASVLYTIQIYCDFAGYSLIAIGTAKMLGIKLMENFRRPYFATSIKDFWGRWHISLSTWFRDYVYIPLGGNRVSKSRNVFNLITTFLVSGLWHGAAWNFILWGGLHGAGQSIEKLSPKRDDRQKSQLVIWSFFQIVLVFIVVNFLWVFFRLDSMNDIKLFFFKAFTSFGSPFFHISLVAGGISIMILFIKDFVDEFFPSFSLLNNRNFLVSNCSTGVLVAIIFLLGVFDSSSFIYFQF